MPTFNGALLRKYVPPAPALDPADPLTGIELQDPAFAAFLRASQARESAIEGQRNSTVDYLHQGQLLSDDAFDTQSVNTERQIGQSFQNRGLFRSGQRLAVTNRSLNEIARNRLNADRGTTYQIGQANRSAALNLASERTNVAGERLAALRRLEERRRGSGLG